MESEHESDNQPVSYEAVPLLAEPEPLTEPPQQKPVWGFWATVGFSLAIGTVSLMAQMAMLLGLVLRDLDPASLMDPAALTNYFTDHLGLIMGLATLISTVITVAAIVGVIKIRRGASITEYLGLRRMSLKTWVWLLLITLVAITAVSALSYYIEQPMGDDFDTQLFNTSVSPVLLWLAVVVLAPIHEELIFRSFLFEGLRYSWLGAAGTIFVTSLVWAALHVQYYFNGYAVGTIFGLGLVMGFVRLRTRSIWSTLFIHGLYNLAAMLMVVFGV